ncbi:MAG: T9SS type A sorting domain-containing protein [Flavobacteriales bacterium]|nr:hypothetical protein [Flavobacteriales bacterium]MCC6578672.1 T9SS type A sorting domain-containing protein [Flavobacteriales bacterium]
MSPSLLVRACCTALLLAAGTNARSSHHVQGTDAAPVTSEPIEANEKTVNDIYLAIVGKDVDSFSSDQTIALFDIASQCPMLGGNSVFKARSLYWLIDDPYDFDDASICLPYGIIVKSLSQSHGNVVRVVPNPAHDEATLLLMEEAGNRTHLTLFNAVGSEVLRSPVPKGTSRHVFSILSLAPGLYHYIVLSNGGLMGDGKLTIVR